MDENDKIIKLTDSLQTKASEAAGEEFTVDFAESDYANDFMPGTTNQHLETAAQHAGLEVAQKGSNLARLRPRQPEDTFREAPFSID